MPLPIIQFLRDEGYTSLPLFGEMVFKRDGRVKVETTGGNLLLDCSETLFNEMIKRGYIEEWKKEGAI